MTLDIFSFVVDNYFGFITSWWWVSIWVVSFVSFTAILLRDSYLSFTKWEAATFSLIALVSIVPFLENITHGASRTEFFSRWNYIAVESHGYHSRFSSFKFFVFCVLLTTYWFAPIWLIQIWISRIYLILKIKWEMRNWK